MLQLIKKEEKHVDTGGDTLQRTPAGFRHPAPGFYGRLSQRPVTTQCGAVTPSLRFSLGGSCQDEVLLTSFLESRMPGDLPKTEATSLRMDRIVAFFVVVVVFGDAASVCLSFMSLGSHCEARWGFPACSWAGMSSDPLLSRPENKPERGVGCHIVKCCGYFFASSVCATGPGHLV